MIFDSEKRTITIYTLNEAMNDIVYELAVVFTLNDKLETSTYITITLTFVVLPIAQMPGKAPELNA